MNDGRLDHDQVILVGQGREVVLDDEARAPRPCALRYSSSASPKVAGWSFLTRSATSSADEGSGRSRHRPRRARLCIGEHLLPDREDLVAVGLELARPNDLLEALGTRAFQSASARGSTSSRSHAACSASAAFARSSAPPRAASAGPHRGSRRGPRPRSCRGSAGSEAVLSRSISIHSRTGSVSRSRVSARYRGASSRRPPCFRGAPRVARSRA